MNQSTTITENDDDDGVDKDDGDDDDAYDYDVDDDVCKAEIIQKDIQNGISYFAW